MNASVKSALEFVFSRFYSRRTGLLYDYTADPEQHAAVFLPSPEQIACHYPNPNGWGTGMEDSVLNGGSLLDALIGAWHASPDDMLRDLALQIFDGLLRCASIPDSPGFVARRSARLTAFPATLAHPGTSTPIGSTVRYGFLTVDSATPDESETFSMYWKQSAKNACMM